MRRSEPKVLVHSSNGRRFTAVGFFRHVPEMRKSAETVGFLTDRTDRPGLNDSVKPLLNSDFN